VFHNIADTHVLLHHLFPAMPHYYSAEAGARREYYVQVRCDAGRARGVACGDKF
jgi:fatty acid desaturase